ASDFYKNLGTGYDEVYMRWYVKYQAGVLWHHSGVWFGGYNPASNWPSPHAGEKPSGMDRFSISVEPVWGSGTASPKFDFYNYWMNMHNNVSSGLFYGNPIINDN